MILISKDCNNSDANVLQKIWMMLHWLCKQKRHVIWVVTIMLCSVVTRPISSRYGQPDFLCVVCPCKLSKHSTTLSVLLFIFNLIHVIIPFGKFGPPYMRKGYTSHKSSATQSYKCMLVVFFPRISLIHRTLTWTTWSLTSVSDHSYACVCKRGLGTPTTSQSNILTRTNSHKCFFTGQICRPDITSEVHWALI